MTGRLIYMMGPSGAGKDTVLQGVAGAMGGRAWVAPRVCTRQHGSNDHAMAPAEFDRLEQAGRFALAWRAHGWCYGIGREIEARMEQGQDVFVNGSRAYLPTARRRYPDLIAVLLTAEPALLQARLAARGRESAAAIESRLARNADVPGEREADVCIANDGEPHEAIAALEAWLAQHDEERRKSLLTATI